MTILLTPAARAIAADFDADEAAGWTAQLAGAAYQLTDAARNLGPGAARARLEKDARAFQRAADLIAAIILETDDDDESETQESQ